MDAKQLYLSFEGRIPRSTCWLKYFLPWAATLVLAVLIDTADGTSGPLTAIMFLLWIYPGLAMVVKRCHDRDRSGWILLVGLVPVVGIWVTIELWFLRGTVGQNKYGPDPLGGEEQAELE